LAFFVSVSPEPWSSEPPTVAFFNEVARRIAANYCQAAGVAGPVTHPETTMSKIKPEAAYFVAEYGQRCAMMFFDMNDASDIPGIVEPSFAGFSARVQLLPLSVRLFD
jgi:hypothetical protein